VEPQTPSARDEPPPGVPRRPSRCAQRSTTRVPSGLLLSCTSSPSWYGGLNTTFSTVLAPSREEDAIASKRVFGVGDYAGVACASSWLVISWGFW
ncbi:hypothetical protein JTE90_002008, partial [Oedothorax gibbosus]